jgi:hypothetical protein
VASTGGGGTGGEGPGGGGGPAQARKDRAGGGPAQARKDRAGGRSTGALCTRFTLQSIPIKGMDEMFVRLDDGTDFGEAFFLLATVRPD